MNGLIDLWMDALMERDGLKNDRRTDEWMDGWTGKWIYPMD